MNKSTLIRKWGIRAVVVIGALLGISACTHTKRVVEDNNYNNNNYNNNYNNDNNTPPIHNLKYGPLINTYKDNPVLIKETVDENGSVKYDTISSK